MRDCAQKPDWKGEHRKCEHTQSYVSLGCEHGDQRSCRKPLPNSEPEMHPTQTGGGLGGKGSMS